MTLIIRCKISKKKFRTSSAKFMCPTEYMNINSLGITQQIFFPTSSSRFRAEKINKQGDRVMRIQKEHRV